MDSSNPLRALTAHVDADVLAVLARTHGPLTGRRVHKLAGRSYAQVQVVLRRLVAQGVVDAERHGNAISYTLNREHVLASVVEIATTAADEVEGRLRDALSAWRPLPVAAMVFGSFARRDGGADSDIDLLLIRPDDIAENDEGWSAHRYDLIRQLERSTGNRVQVVELTSAELASAANRGDDLIRAIREDGRELIGPEPRRLLDDVVSRPAR
jgi:predicted nucleotidyltransferase